MSVSQFASRAQTISVSCANMINIPSTTKHWSTEALHTVLYLVVQWRTCQRSPSKQLVGPLACRFFMYEIHTSSFLMIWLPMIHNHFRETAPITSSLSFPRESIKGPKTVPMVSTYMHNVLSIFVMDQYMAAIIWIDSNILCSYNVLCHMPFPCKSPSHQVFRYIYQKNIH